MLVAAGLAAFRGERLVFRDVGFAIASGGALRLTGPNGSGKSTRLRLLAGLVRPCAGRLVWDEDDALADLPTHAARVAYVGHLDAVKPALTVAENLHFAAQLTGGVVLDALNHILDIAIPEFRSQGGTLIIPGHGRLCDTGDVANYRNMVAIIRDRIQALIKEGMTLEQVKAAKPTLDYDGLYGSGDKFIEAAYRSLKK